MIDPDSRVKRCQVEMQLLSEICKKSKKRRDIRGIFRYRDKQNGFSGVVAG